MKRSLLRALPLAAAVMLLAGCSSLNPFASSGPAPAPLAEFRPTAELLPLWSAQIGDAGDYVFQPAVAGDAVYAASNDGEVARFEAGRAVWQAGAGKPLSAGVGSDGRLAVVVATDGTVIAYDAASGSERGSTWIGPRRMSRRAIRGWPAATRSTCRWWIRTAIAAR